MKQSTVALILQGLLIAIVLQHADTTGGMWFLAVSANAVLVVGYGYFKRTEDKPKGYPWRD